MIDERATAGFSLIELMVALVAGMIVVGAVLALHRLQRSSQLRIRQVHAPDPGTAQHQRPDRLGTETRRVRRGRDEVRRQSVFTRRSNFSPILRGYERLPELRDLRVRPRARRTARRHRPGQRRIRAIRRSTVTAAVGVIEMAGSATGVQPDLRRRWSGLLAYPPPACQQRLVSAERPARDQHRYVHCEHDRVRRQSDGVQTIAAVGRVSMPCRCASSRSPLMDPW